MIRARVLAPLALCAIIGGACSDSTSSLRPTKGFTSVYLTDAPMPFDSIASVNLYVVSIAASPDADTTGTGTWVTLAEPHRAYNLLDLQSGRTALAGAANIPAGDYRAVRVVIDTDSSSIIGTDGRPRAIDWQASVGRPVLNALVENPVSVPDDGGAIVIDFDAGRSFLCVGACPPFVFSPVLRAVEQAETGSVTGTVMGTDGSGAHAPLAGATVAAYHVAMVDPPVVPMGASSTVPVTTLAVTDANGNYTLPYLLPGRYVVMAYPPSGSGLAFAQLDSVIVTAGAVTSAQNLVLPLAPAIASLAVTPESTTVDAGSTVQLSAQADDANGQPVYANVHWSVDDSTVATVDSAGTVTGRANGTATITATAGSVSAHAVVTVTTGVGSVTVTPSSLSLAVGDSAYLSATVRDASGSVITRSVTWASSDSTVAHVYFDGTVKALKSGSATISAWAGGKVGQAGVVVQ